jgi:hypothetical protein
VALVRAARSPFGHCWISIPVLGSGWGGGWFSFLGARLFLIQAAGIDISGLCWVLWWALFGIGDGVQVGIDCNSLWAVATLRAARCALVFDCWRNRSNPLSGSNPLSLVDLMQIFSRAALRRAAGDFLYGGERGIRTLDRGLTYTPLAGARLQPLGHLSKNARKSYHTSCQMAVGSGFISLLCFRGLGSL